jgi:Uma2 family endonuclease
MLEVMTAAEIGVIPDISNLVTEDDTPVDNFFSAELQRLLVDSLYSSWAQTHQRKFVADANVGIFSAIKRPPIVPDMFLSLDVEVERNFCQKSNRSYFVWEMGKPPEVVIEIVSNQSGNELGSKLRDYAAICVSYYAVFDPLAQLSDRLLRVFGLHEGQYHELSPVLGKDAQALYWLEQVNLGLIVKSGEYEGKQDTWLRWCDRQGEIYLTGSELAKQADLKLIQERQKSERLAEKLRSLGIDPDV